jgi:hypothetical protein
MASDFIPIDATKAGATQANVLKSYIQTLRTAYELGGRVKGIMDHNQDGTVWTALEALFGLPAGKGQTVYNLVNGSVGAMEGTFQNDDSKQITEQVG